MGGASRYIPEELNSDLQQIQIYYKSHGFAAVTIGEPRIQATGVKSNQRIEIEIPIVEGERYRLKSVKVEGSFDFGAVEVDKIVGVLPSEYNFSLLDSTRQKIVDALGHYGYGLARVDLEQIPNKADRSIEAVYNVAAGYPVAIGKIEFQGNNRIPDRFLRRELRSREGDIFDSVKLDKSVERLNKSNMLKEIHRADVALKLNEETNLLDVTFNVKEKDRQGIYATGGDGGITGGVLDSCIPRLIFCALERHYHWNWMAARPNQICC